MPIIVDAHEDLAWNALTFGRDYTRSVLETRQLELGGPAPHHNGTSMLGLPQFLEGQVAVIFSTLFVAPARKQESGWDAQVYADEEDAYRLANTQLDYYRRLVDDNPQFSIIGGRGDLERVLGTWEGGDPAARQVGLVPLMEGADPIRTPQEAEYWMERGVRIVGLSWSGTRYAGGTGEPGPLTPEGRALLEVMGSLGLILDVSHASDESCLEALDRYSGVVVATHANPRALLKGFSRPERMLTDQMIERLAEAGGVIGIVPYNRFLSAAWENSHPKSSVTIDSMLAMIDHVCQVTGSSAHVGIGSDFDGGFGLERTPAEFDTVADLQKLGPALTARGYTEQDAAAILGQNWLRVLRRGLARMTAQPPPAGPLPAEPPAQRDRDDLSTSRLARFGVAVVVAGFFFFVIGVFPDLIRLGLTPGIGLLQIGAFLIGITIMTLGAYIYAYATRHRAMPRRLREDIGLRLMATGLVIAYATGFADVLGIGSHFGADRPLFGLWQGAGVALGVLTIITGIFLYARR